MAKEVFNSPNSVDVNIVKSLLEDNEIVSEIRDDGIVSANQLFANAVGGVKLFVEDSDFEKAQTLVQEYLKAPASNYMDDENFDFGEAEVDDQGEVCPSCGSMNIKNDRSFYVFLYILIGFIACIVIKNIFIWLGILVGYFFFSRIKFVSRCFSCKHKWK